MKEIIKSYLDKRGYSIKRINKLDDPFEVIKNRLNQDDLVILDVGAHIGETALSLSTKFPLSKIYSFEPFIESYNQLVQNVSKLTNVKTINKGVSDATSIKSFNVNKGSPTNSLLKLDDNASLTWSNEGLSYEKTIECSFISIDDFIKENKIANIDLLKIDVQGSEYLVLRGAEKSLKDKVVKIIYMEIIIGETYIGQKTLEWYIIEMKKYGYYLSGMYNLTYSKKMDLIQLDAIFVSNKFE